MDGGGQRPTCWGSGGLLPPRRNKAVKYEQAELGTYHDPVLLLYSRLGIQPLLHASPYIMKRNHACSRVIKFPSSCLVAREVTLAVLQATKQQWQMERARDGTPFRHSLARCWSHADAKKETLGFAALGSFDLHDFITKNASSHQTIYGWGYRSQEHGRTSNMTVYEYTHYINIYIYI